MGDFVTTTCATSPTRLGRAGALTTTTYELTAVTVLGNPTVCRSGGGYEAREHRGGLKVTATSGTTATFEFLDQFRRPGAARVSVRRWDVDVEAKDGRLTFTPRACSVNSPPTETSYSTGPAAGGKKTLTLRLPWGASSEAIYRYTEK